MEDPELIAGVQLELLGVGAIPLQLWGQTARYYIRRDCDRQLIRSVYGGPALFAAKSMAVDVVLALAAGHTNSIYTWG